MNINKTITSLLIVLLSFFSVKADEGMWLPFLLNEHNYEDMKKMGLNLTPEQLYDINQSSLKDAIVSFGGFPYLSISSFSMSKRTWWFKPLFIFV